VAGTTVAGSQAAAPPPPPTVTLSGRVSRVSGSCPTLTFTVDGTTVTTSADTTFAAGPCRNLERGTDVAVSGIRTETGTVEAARVTFLRDDE